MLVREESGFQLPLVVFITAVKLDQRPRPEPSWCVRDACDGGSCSVYHWWFSKSAVLGFQFLGWVSAIWRGFHTWNCEFHACDVGFTPRARVSRSRREFHALRPGFTHNPRVSCGRLSFSSYPGPRVSVSSPPWPTTPWVSAFSSR